MTYKEFLQIIEDNQYCYENYCIYKFTLGSFGEYIGKVERDSLIVRYKKGSSKKVKAAIDNCSVSDFKIEIVYRNSDINILRDREIELISQLDPQTKLNTHKGGIISNDKILRKFQNLETGEIVEKACCDMVKDYGGSSGAFVSLYTKNTFTAYGWCRPEKYNSLRSEGKQRRGNVRKHFKRVSDGLQAYLSCAEMVKEYGGSHHQYSCIVLNKAQIGNGWCLPENYEKIKSESRGLGYGVSIRYKFKRLTDNLVEYLSATEMARKYEGSSRGFSRLANKKTQQYKGWKVI